MEGLCLKAIACLVTELPYDVQISKICTDIEQSTGVEYCFVLERYNNVFLTEREGSSIVIEMKADDVFSNMCARRQPVYCNDLTKDRVVLNHLK